MSSSLDMALDDVITVNKRNNRTGGGINKRGHGNRNQSQQTRRSTAGGPVRRNPTPAPRGPRNSLLVSNLHHKVTEKDLYDLFGQLGNVKRAFLHLGPDGKSSGVADIVYAQANDAERARNTYNNIELDGRPMRISFANLPAAVASALPINRRIQAGRNQNTYNNNNNNSSRNTRRPGNNQRGRGSGRPRREARPQASQADLDADMDSYMAEE
ncbi:hypothetical protein BCR42DRAFT_410742 [Absidia repens]|uniref:RRM domain-containing protein n=1 Tax=Absidia repens TaxID=90262 RepID=A0A1X2IQY2_9FUNG|nr:hypothetical protein BCR42DRAFT_410742 [Absidia repens]